MRGALIAIGLLLLGCQAAEECKDFGAGNNGEGSWGQCGDKKTRKVSCEGVERGALKVPGKPVTCTCSVEGVVGKKFETSDPNKLMILESATQLANEQCGWQLKR